MKKLILILTIVFAFSNARSQQIANGPMDTKPATSATVTDAHQQSVSASATGTVNDQSSTTEKKQAKKSKKNSKECSTDGASTGKSCCQHGTSKAAVISPAGAGTEAKPVEEPLEPVTPKF